MQSEQIQSILIDSISYDGSINTLKFYPSITGKGDHNAKRDVVRILNKLNRDYKTRIGTQEIFIAPSVAIELIVHDVAFKKLSNHNDILNIASSVWQVAIPSQVPAVNELDNSQPKYYQDPNGDIYYSLKVLVELEGGVYRGIDNLTRRNIDLSNVFIKPINSRFPSSLLSGGNELEFMKAHNPLGYYWLNLAGVSEWAIKSDHSIFVPYKKDALKLIQDHFDNKIKTIQSNKLNTIDGISSEIYKAVTKAMTDFYAKSKMEENINHNLKITKGIAVNINNDSNKRKLIKTDICNNPIKTINKKKLSKVYIHVIQDEYGITFYLGESSDLEKRRKNETRRFIYHYSLNSEESKNKIIEEDARNILLNKYKFKNTINDGKLDKYVFNGEDKRTFILFLNEYSYDGSKFERDGRSNKSINKKDNDMPLFDAIIS